MFTRLRLLVIFAAFMLALTRVGEAQYPTPAPPLTTLSYQVVAAGTATLAASTTSSRVALPTGGPTLWVTNPSLVPVYLVLGSGSVVATTASKLLIGPGQTSQPLGIAGNADLAAITATGSATLQLTVGYLAPVVVPTTWALAVSTVALQGSSQIVSGSYCMAQDTGVMAAGLAGGAPIFSFRYGGSQLAIVRKVTLTLGDNGTAFAAGSFLFDMLAARSFSASDTGGTAALLTGNTGKLRTSFATTGLSDFRIASTATLTAGTRTLDATQLASLATSTPATAGQPTGLPTQILFQQAAGEQPLQLANNEGFVIQATVPANGTWKASIGVCWDEVAVY